VVYASLAFVAIPTLLICVFCQNIFMHEEKMRITKVRCQLLTASTNLSALGATLANWTTALAIIETDTGLTGIGECYAGLFAPDAVAALVEQFSPLRC